MCFDLMCYADVQERMLGEDGNPRKTKENEDPFHMGLVLEWVHGTIVSTAEKARDSAKKILGAHCNLAWIHTHISGATQIFIFSGRSICCRLSMSKHRSPRDPNFRRSNTAYLVLVLPCGLTEHTLI